MPELPDIAVYVEALRRRVEGARLVSSRIRGPFLLHTFDPPIDAIESRAVVSVERLAKRIVIGFDNDLFLVLHLMIAGRLLWKKSGAKPTGKIDLAAFEFEGETPGTLVLTEASKQKRAALYLIRGRDAVAAHDPGGIEPLSCSLAQFTAAVTRENHTIKRTLTDPHIFSGIGNAYSDEILHAAKLSPLKLTKTFTSDDIARLHEATRETLTAWIDTLRREFALDRAGPGRFPGRGDITAFRPDFAVHGKFKKPCPACGAIVQRIIRGDHETNYCPKCQTGGRILADRSLSRLLKDDWPTRVDE